MLKVQKKELLALIIWLRQQGTQYPWGDNITPYRVWISEVMLQQTTTEAVKERFNRFITHYPSVTALAQSPEEELLREWEGLGYYSRARNLLKGAAHVVEKYNGVVPESYDELVKIPGIGDYTACAILSIAFNYPAIVLDANVRRISSRITEAHLTDEQIRDLWQGAFGNSSSEGFVVEPREFSPAIMQLGQLICRPKSPYCLICPLRDVCLASKHGTTALYPPKAKKIYGLLHHYAYLIFLDHGKSIALEKRSTGVGTGQYFLPRVDVMSGAPQGKLLATRKVHAYTRYKDALDIYKLSANNIGEVPEIIKTENQQLTVVKVENIESLPMSSFYRRVLREVFSL